MIGIVRNQDSRDRLRAELPADARVLLLVADLATPGALCTALHEARIPADSVSIAILSAAIKHDGKSVLSLTRTARNVPGQPLRRRRTGRLALRPRRQWARRRFRPDSQPDASSDSGSAQVAAAAPREVTRDPPLSSTTRVVLVSSMGRWHGMYFSGGYNASKAALSIWGESLDMELRQRGKQRFTVTVVEPGIFASGMTRQTPLTRALFASRDKVAARILSGALEGRPAIRPPRWFALLTWAVCLIGRDRRYRLFARAKPRADR